MEIRHEVGIGRAFGIFARFAVGSLGALIVTACGMWPFTGETPVVLPGPTGPYAVGRTVFDWTDRSRQETLSTDPSAGRELLVWVWYPATPGPDAVAAPYVPRAWAAALNKEHGIVQQLGLNQDLSRVGAHSPSEPDNGPSDVINAEATRLTEICAHDILFVDGRLSSENNDPASLLYRHLDLSKLAAVGHSMGGAASAEASMSSAAIRAVVDLDGTLFGSDVTNHGVSAKFLIMSSDRSDPTIDSSYAASLSKGALHLRITGARHFNFSDFSVLNVPVMRWMNMIGPIDGRRMLAIVDIYVRAFLDESLRGERSPLLSGPSAAYPEVEFSNR